ncbi:Tetratricopeptide repeat-containing protein [Chitinophaga costaii]|uniref:Tetratricopeptide repeat-containing protein n=1 Tax=Chitinophaga costaii TaxID=1335309 RepID=A0A1C4F9B8_9BACT|nr:tetratricopeptide repeat protein [Chitinophaga costaii]PUZ21174.1 tetratricopeptide repeat protein [Chitinophaga costaii]SCC52436.1 Tetratricopeptide repeat-containing protein [Chitinophaga costaii]
MRIGIALISLALLASACNNTKHTTGTVLHVRDTAALHRWSDSLFFAAQRSKMAGDYKRAVSQFSDVLRVQPQNATVYYELSRLFSQLHNESYSLGFAKRAAAMDTTNRWFQLNLADALTNDSRFDSAALIYDRLSRLYPDNDDYLYNKGLLLSRAGDTEGALDAFDSLEKRSGVVEEVVYQKQRMLLKLSRIDEAAAEIQQLINQNPTELRYYQLLAALYDANDRTEEARKNYEYILSRDPNDTHALMALSSYAKKNNDTTTYWKYLTRAFASPDFSIDEKVAYIYPFLQMATIDSSKLREALTLSSLIVQAHPTAAKGYALRGDIYSQTEQLDSALADYNQAITLDSSRFTVWYQEMLIYSRMNNSQALLDASNLVNRRFPHEFMGFYFNGMANYLLKHYPETIAALKKAIEVGADKKMLANIYSLLGDTYHAMDNDLQSDSSYELALALQPEDPLVLNNYSYYLSVRGVQLEKAEQMSRASLELEPESPNYMDTYAWILFRLGRYTDAKTWMEKALQYPASQDSPGMLEHYGDILFNLKDADKAVEYWQKARDKGGDSSLLARKIAEKRYIPDVTPAHP